MSDEEQSQEIKKHREVVLEAIALYDAGYWIYEELPGKLMPYGASQAIEVSDAVWYFLMGIRFGIGDKMKRDLEQGKAP